MTIRCALLGLLHWQALSGYDLKKILEDSSVFYWSGNNNQVYRTLLQLEKDGLVSQTLDSSSLPVRKVYSITPAGVGELRTWLLSTPEPPEFRSTFLIQLGWADLLDSAQIQRMLQTYEDEARTLALMQRESARRAAFKPQRTPREAFLWEQIQQNILAFYENEAAWAQHTRQRLAAEFS